LNNFLIVINQFYKENCYGSVKWRGFGKSRENLSNITNKIAFFAKIVVERELFFREIKVREGI
jgi:hypothetical protein